MKIEMDVDLPNQHFYYKPGDLKGGYDKFDKMALKCWIRENQFDNFFIKTLIATWIYMATINQPL